ncbi:FixH family protein [Rufibacter roseus]|uniref:FixH family protein n=1 Tax=Rufibacter roseus TaxID=1567108 RepID=A0ABW2DPZ7_9BACT|nr:FixH family protein [Rufibacter roseus]
MKALPKQTASWWPKLIIAAYVFFILFVANMVRMTMQSDVDLVSKDYYQKEIEYQQHMDQVKATNAMDTQVLLNHAEAAELLSVVFPADLKADGLKGEVVFLRPSDSKKDFTVPMNLNSDGQQHIPTAQLAKGLWRVQLNWSQDKQSYFLEKDITIK